MGAMLPSSTHIRNQASAPKAGDQSTDFLSILEERGSNIVYEGEPFYAGVGQPMVGANNSRSKHGTGAGPEMSMRRPVPQNLTGYPARSQAVRPRSA